MTKLQYIKVSHKKANRRIWEWLMSKRPRNVIAGYLWLFISGLIMVGIYTLRIGSFFMLLFEDLKFTVNFMETEIEHDDINSNKIAEYLDTKEQSYKLHLSHGHYSNRERQNITSTFEYLRTKYHSSSKAEPQQVKSQNIEQHTAIDTTPTSFCHHLSKEQIAALAESINRIEIFKRAVTPKELSNTLNCRHTEPLICSHNKQLALLLKLLSDNMLITHAWQRVCEKYNCFASRSGKPLTAKDLSAAKTMVDNVGTKREEQIKDCIDDIVDM